MTHSRTPGSRVDGHSADAPARRRDRPACVGRAIAARSPSSPTSGGDTTTRTSTLDGKLSVPAGFAVTYFAKGLYGVGSWPSSPDGAVYASQPGQGPRACASPTRTTTAWPTASSSSCRGWRSRTASPFTRARSTSPTRTAWCASRSAPMGVDGRAGLREPLLRRRRALVAHDRVRRRQRDVRRRRLVVQPVRRAVERSRGGAAVQRGRIGQARVSRPDCATPSGSRSSRRRARCGRRRTSATTSRPTTRTCRRRRSTSSPTAATTAGRTATAIACRIPEYNDAARCARTIPPALRSCRRTPRRSA